jgi:2Fe-2S ferredoxin
VADDSPDDRGRFGLRRALRRGAAGLGRRLRGADPKPTVEASIRFGPDPAIPVAPGVTVLAAARAAGVDLTHYCGGTCSCGTCRIEVVSGGDHLSAVQGREQMVLGAERHAAGDRLACQARVEGPVHVRIPDWF